MFSRVITFLTMRQPEPKVRDPQGNLESHTGNEQARAALSHLVGYMTIQSSSGREVVDVWDVVDVEFRVWKLDLKVSESWFARWHTWQVSCVSGSSNKQEIRHNMIKRAPLIRKIAPWIKTIGGSSRHDFISCRLSSIRLKNQSKFPDWSQISSVESVLATMTTPGGWCHSHQ